VTLTRWVKFVFLLILVYIDSFKVKSMDFSQRYQRLNNWCKQFFKRMPFKLEVIGLENIAPYQAYYYVSNHQGSFDPVVLVAANSYPHTYISKSENLKLPVIGKWGKLIGFIPFKREAFDENVTMLREASRKLKQGQSICVFPEGTRSKSNQLINFKAGALVPAYLAKVSIIPTAMVNSYQLDHSKVDTITVLYGKPLLYADYKDMSYDQCMDSVKQTIQTLIKTGLKEI
jgi:1-acyl-sn-glycerol-3-phosphate acyltransferase